MKTFKQQITVPDELVTGFAEFLGYQENEEQTADEYVAEKAKEHMQQFFMPFGYKLVMDNLQEAREQLTAQIIDPVKEGLISEIVSS